MTDDSLATDTAAGLDLERTAAWIESQRWYASKSRAISGLGVELAAELAGETPLTLLLVQARFATGAHDLYQLPLALLDPRAAGERPVIAQAEDGRVAVDALADPELARRLLVAMRDGAVLDTGEGCVRFQHMAEAGPLPVEASARAIGVEQSNSSIVFGSETVLKVFRRVEAGINPELEVLRFLAAHDFRAIAPLSGWYEFEGRSFAATLGVAQRFLPDARGGWELALEQIRTDPAAFIVELGALGRVTAQLHNALASDFGDPAFAPEEPSAESLALLVATVDEDIERVFVRLPDDERVAPIAGRGQDVREHIAQRAQLGVGGRAIRTHGDYHLGQTLHLPNAAPHGERWVIIDFEGEPARPLFERRQKASPLRDVAGMLRSFAYATSAVAIMFGQPAPGQFEDRARQAFLEQYFTTIEPSLLPAGESAVLNLLAIFELEKAIYELQYELDNRPDWLPIPVAGIARLLEDA
jgi:maltokinase